MVWVSPAGCGNEVQPADVPRWRQRILAEATSIAHVYLAGAEHGQPLTRQLKEITESTIAPDYRGRALVELLQNGHDAHPRDRSDGRVELALHPDEGDHGVFYATNGGSPLNDDNFTALCRVARSSKSPSEGIGHKGVGFKSVLHLTDAPEIYSRATPGSGRFDGYCFRFARPSDFDDLAALVAPDRPGFADELRANVSSLQVPVCLHDVPARVSAYATEGFSTVIRLPLRSAEAREEVVRQLREMSDQNVPPFELFLERLGAVALVDESGGTEARREYSRKATDLLVLDDLRVQEVRLSRGPRLLMVTSRIDEASVGRAIAESRTERSMGATWEEWHGDAAVNVAVSMDETITATRMYTFLPMGAGAKAPFAGYLNAPFFAGLDRRSLNRDMPWNSRLLDQAATACAHVAQLAAANQLSLPDGALLDLVSWYTNDIPRLAAAFARIGTDLDTIPFIPVLHPRLGRTCLGRAQVWKPQQCTRFTPAAAALTGVPDLVDHQAIGPRRLDRLEKLAVYRKRALRPAPSTLASWAERCAAALAADNASGQAWGEFYDDLARTVSAEQCLDRTLLLTHEGALVRPSTDNGNVFFAPEPLPGTHGTGHPRALPPALNRHIVFLHPGIALTLVTTNRPTEGRKWLEGNGLVQRYCTETVLELIAHAMTAAGGEEHQLHACLAAAFQTWSGSTTADGTAITAHLLVPTVGGWLPTHEAVFGEEWPDPAGSRIDAVLTEFLQRSDTRCPSLDDVSRRLLLSPAEVLPEAPAAQLQRFLEQCGIQHGLPLQSVPVSIRVLGRHLARPLMMPWESGWGLHQEEFRQWIAAADRTASPTRPSPHLSYECESLHRIPGQEIFDGLGDTGRELYAELVLHGLQTWPTYSAEFRSGSCTITWPSPLVGFLSKAAWFPQTVPDNRSTATFRRPDEAWLVPAQDRAPDFLPTQPARVNRHIDERVQVRLGTLGVRNWKDPASAADRVQYLVDLVRDTPAVRHARHASAVRKAYEVAWADLLPTSSAESPAGPKTLDVLVQRSGVLGVLPANGPEGIYVRDGRGAAVHGLLEQTRAAVLPLRRTGLAAKVQKYLTRHGGTSLRPASSANVELIVDGESFDRAVQQGLLDAVGPWLPVAVAGLLELHPQPGQLQFAEVMETLSAATLTIARQVTPIIEGHPAPVSDRAHALLHKSPMGPDIVSVPGIAADGSGLPMWPAVQAASTVITDLLGVPGLADSLRLHLIDLERRCPAPRAVTVEDIASVLELDVAELRDLALGYAVTEATVDRVMPLLACIDAAVAEQFVVERHTLKSAQDLETWLVSRLAGTDAQAGLLLALADSEDLYGALCALGITLQEANSRWRAHGYQLLHHADGHARQFESWMQRHSARLTDRLRDAFVLRYQRDGDPQGYMETCAALSAVGPDPSWLDVHWNLSDDLLHAHLDAWLATRAPSVPMSGPPLPPVAELSRHNREKIRQWLAEPTAHFASQDLLPEPTPGLRRPSASQAIRALAAHGLLDFEELTPESTVRLLRRLGLWTVEDVRAARRTSEEGKEMSVQRQHGQSPRAGAIPPTAADALPAFAEDFARRLGSIRSTADLTPAPPRSPARAVGHPLRPGGTTAPAPDSMSAQQIGLAGEMVAGEWLRQRYGVPPKESWVSGFRNTVLGDNRGDDGLGYDFVITLPEARHYFEVKASERDDYEFELGATQVRRARELALDETYSVLYISHIRDEDARLLTCLPNPFSPQGRPLYQLTAETRRLRFFPLHGKREP
ncbi:sacsin N-terminal ATP-binding-like domain-containing protein [Streptomyces gilvosporeus]|uniref:Protein NO VEIN C-terminal domain-containing protein n=1 Tax=Streptomyces gilvosporeus TaxID=553510 RepID=A0A1V0TYG0_9ACTN|nr:hypothetical protein [Streptomyces gilvosporeus]ARF57976.1 hypothetical protein B1H19_30675 [Streptomyces gilvosporeus]